MTVLPAVSVVIPVRNEAEAIGVAIGSALDQEYGGGIEVVIADGASTDGTADVVRDGYRTDPRVRLVDNPEAKTPTGLNVAIQATSGDVVVRCDAHAELPPGYIAHTVRLLEETGADVVGGVQHAVGTSDYERAVAAAMLSPFGAGGATYRTGTEPGPTDTVYLGVFRRSALERVGLFDESLVRNQDYDLNRRIRDTGGTVYFHPDLAVDYRPRPNPAALWSQYWQYGAWKREVLRRDPDSMRLRQLAPPALVAGLGLSVVLALTGRRRFGGVLPLTYGAAIAVAASRAKPGADPFQVARALATMHLAWGLGFFVGRARAGSPRIPPLEAR